MTLQNSHQGIKINGLFFLDKSEIKHGDEEDVFSPVNRGSYLLFRNLDLNTRSQTNQKIGLEEIYKFFSVNLILKNKD